MQPPWNGVGPKVGVAFSSGFFGFFAHAGFLAALREVGIQPTAFAGSSSGAIVAAMGASGMSDADILKTLLGVKRKDFWDPEPFYVLVSRMLRRLQGYTGYLKGEGFARILGRLPIRTFEECPFSLAVSATNLTRRREEIFTRGDLIKAVQASGAVPMLFKPVEIKGCLFVDGGLVNKAPVRALTDVRGVDRIIVHFIASANLRSPVHEFMKKSWTPLHIHRLAVNIARQEAYSRQVREARDLGIHVIEVETRPPAVGPHTLQRGPSSYRTARTSALKTLRLHDPSKSP